MPRLHGPTAGIQLVAWITRSPDVRLRIGDNAYDMRATRIESGRQDIFQMYIDRYKDNYPEIIASFPPIEQFAQGALFELVGR